jgi:hypothetical protein
MPHHIPQSTRIVVVGNGHKLSKVMQGLLIDQYDVVVRVGDFKIRGYEPYVGTKTTIWTLAGCDRARRDAPKDAVNLWEDNQFAHIDFRRFPPKGNINIPMLPEGIVPSDTFKSLMACVYRWPKNLVSITGYGPGCYWTGEEGEPNEIFKEESGAIQRLMSHGLVWDRLG